MKTNRQSKIIEIIQKNEVETQDELSALLEKDGFRVTQATVSRDIRELKLTKIPTAGGRQKYAVIRMHLRISQRNTKEYSERAFCQWIWHRISSL